jgi:hypothetical protein
VSAQPEAGSSPRLDAIYAVLSGDDPSDRACEAIPDSACREIPRNYLLNLASGAASKLAEQLAGPNLVLPWLLGAIAAPAWMVGLCMPAKQTGSLLPQLAVSGWMRGFRLRKYFWLAAALIQAGCLALMIPAALWLPSTAAGLVIVGLLLAFSLASGMGSVAFQDVLGKTIPRGRRGRLLASRATVGGLLTVAAGLGLRGLLGASAKLDVYLALMGCAAALWVLAGAAFGATGETPGATEGGRNALAEARHGLRLVRGNTAYARYLLARAALLSVELATPFYALHAQQVVSAGAGDLGLFMAAVGVARIVGSPFWGSRADRSARRVMMLAALAGSGAALLALGIAHAPAYWHQGGFYAGVFLLVGLAEAGVRVGRKTWVVDAAPAAERTTWVAFANTSIGMLTLAAGALGLIAQFAGPDALIGTLGALALGGGGLAALMPEAETGPAD